MPTHSGKDSKGSFYQWGETGKKYYYTPGDRRSVQLAQQKADRQGRAIKHEQARRGQE